MRTIIYVFVSSFLLICFFPFYAYASEPPNFDVVFDIENFVEEQENKGVIKLDEEFSVLAKASPITPSNTNGFHNVIISILGNYEPITVDYTYRQGSSSYDSHNINTAPDYSWICSAAIFGLVIFCTFRFIGGIFRHD